MVPPAGVAGDIGEAGEVGEANVDKPGLVVLLQSFESVEFDDMLAVEPVQFGVLLVELLFEL